MFIIIIYIYDPPRLHSFGQKNLHNVKHFSLLNLENKEDLDFDFSNNSELKSFSLRKSQISVEQRCLLLGYRVVTPIQFRKNKLSERVSRMKSLARSYFWWPAMDKEIENIALSCNEYINGR